MNISIVIPSYNAERHLEKTLTSLAKQGTVQPYEVIVVDCSETAAVESICSRYEFVTCHREPLRFNPGRGRNIGAQLASGSLILFVDADVVLEPQTLEAAWRFYQGKHLLFGGALELNEYANPTTASYLEHYFFNHESQAARPVSTRANLSSALLAVDRKLLLENGGFKDIPRMQDTELTERLAEHGISPMFNPEMVGLQIQDSPLKKVFTKIFITGKNLYYIRYAQSSQFKKAIMLVLLPVMALLKIGRIFLRHMRYQVPAQRVRTVLISPLLGFGSLCWMAGLYHAMLFNSGFDEARD